MNLTWCSKCFRIGIFISSLQKCRNSQCSRVSVVQTSRPDFLSELKYMIHVCDCFSDI